MKLVLKFQTPIENHWTAASVGTHCGSLWSCSTTQWWLTDRQAGRRTGGHVQVFICASTYIWQIEKKPNKNQMAILTRTHTHTRVSMVKRRHFILTLLNLNNSSLEGSRHIRTGGREKWKSKSISLSIKTEIFPRWFTSWTQPCRRLFCRVSGKKKQHSSSVARPGGKLQETGAVSCTSFLHRHWRHMASRYSDFINKFNHFSLFNDGLHFKIENTMK